MGLLLGHRRGPDQQDDATYRNYDPERGPEQVVPRSAIGESPPHQAYVKAEDQRPNTQHHDGLVAQVSLFHLSETIVF